LKIKAVIFDLFETLVSEFTNGDRISNRSYNYLDFLGISNEDFKQAWSSRQQQRMEGYFPDYPSVVKDIIENAGLRYHRETVHYLFDKRIEEKKLPFLNIRPDIIKLLNDLRDDGMKLGLVSNCTEEEVRGWNKSELAPFFDQVLFSYQVGMAKPDIRIYELACEQLSVTPEEAVFIGDGGSDELNGANQAGLQALQAIWFQSHVESQYKKFALPLEVTRELGIAKKEFNVWKIKEVQKWDVEIFWQLRLEALKLNPEAFGSLYEDAVQESMPDAMKRIKNDADDYILGAFTEDGSIKAMIGFRREQATKLRHKGLIWGMYVTREYRGKGIAKELISEVIARGRQLANLKQINLSVVTSNYAAFELYKKLGFEAYGLEKNALIYKEQGYDEYLMAYYY
jgi:putative hydrolase of the HAD superfamily